jgi:hypothetical protein
MDADITSENTTLGAVIAALYDMYLERYGDEELARLAAAARINELLVKQEEHCEQLARCRGPRTCVLEPMAAR